MSKKFKFDHFSAILEYMETYFKNKPEDCILYSEDGTDFKIHKELLSQTVFLRKVLFTANSQYCGKIETTFKFLTITTNIICTFLL